MIDENESRLIFTTDSIKSSIKTIAKHSLRLYKQFATVPRLVRIVGENGDLDIFYFKGSDISSDDVQFDTDNDGNYSMAQRRDMIFTLLDKGLLQDENGKVSNSVKLKIMENIGFGAWDNTVDLSALHAKNADAENKKMFEGQTVDVKPIDDHKLHINQHIAYMLNVVYANEVNKEIESEFLRHIEDHKQKQGE